MTAQIPPLSTAPRLFAFFLGVAVPSVAFGRSVFAVFVGLALISLLIARPWREVVRDLGAQARTPVGLLILITFVAWLPNVFVSSFPARSFEVVLRTLVFVSVASVFYSYLCSDARVRRRVLQTFSVAVAVTLVFALLAMTVLPEIYWLLRLKGWLTEPIGTSLKGFSALAVLMVPLLIVGAGQVSKAEKIACGIISLAALVVVLEAGNKAAIAGFLAMALTLGVVMAVNKATRVQVLSILAGAGVLFLGVVVWLWSDRMLQLTLAPNEDWLIPVWLLDFQRQVIWKAALEFAMASPWIGIGANTINFQPGADAVIEGTSNLHVIPAHPHNWAIEIFAETGAIGLIFLLITIAVWAARTLLQIRRTGRVELIAAIALMAGYWGSGLFNFSYWSAWWQMSFMIALALCFACAQTSNTRLSSEN